MTKTYYRIVSDFENYENGNIHIISSKEWRESTEDVLRDNIPTLEEAQERLKDYGTKEKT